MLFCSEDHQTTIFVACSDIRLDSAANVFFAFTESPESERIFFWTNETLLDVAVSVARDKMTLYSSCGGEILKLLHDI